mgnify:CR=1 FL=1
MKLEDTINSVNIADHLSEDQLVEIGTQVVEGYNTDEKSRGEWNDNIEQWTKMALQISEEKSYPWPKASNIKFPLLSTAAMQFAARAYPTLVPSDGKVVKCKVTGSDMDGEKTRRALRISKHMSYQLTCEMEEWEEDMDRLLVVLPIVGTVFKKTYFDPEKGRNTSCLVMPKNLVVNYWTKNLDDCERVTEIHEFSKRKVTEKMNRGLYRKVDLGDPSLQEKEVSKSDPHKMAIPQEDETTPYTILEQHTFLDLDEDGYPEPYVVIVDLATKEVLRIAPRFTSEDVDVKEDGKVVSINPQSYYTKYSFFPNPDGGFYDIGFGRLIGPINASVDTIINQLIDAGSLSNLQSGFLGKGLRLKLGETRFTPGEWKSVNATGDDLKKQIFPLPVREPSQVLFKLLELLAQSAKELASVAEIFVGKMPGQNTPATTTMASIEQGMKLFTAVYKRVYRSMGKEFQKLYKLNKMYMNPEEEVAVLDEPIQQSDYMGDEKDIVPAADPNASSQQERQAKAEKLLQLLSLGTINPQEVTIRLLEALEEPAIEKLLLQQPPPNPEAQKMQMEMQMKQTESQHDIQMAQAKMQLEAASKEQEMRQKERIMQMDLEYKRQEAVLKARVAELEAQQNMQASQMQHSMSLQQQQENHQMEMMKGADKHQMEMRKAAVQTKKGRSTKTKKE